jgi:hypothetical protein
MEHYLKAARIVDHVIMDGDMPKQVKKKQPKEKKPNQVSLSALISQYMAKIGSAGGKIGGKRRLQTMTAEERRQAAAKAAKARWGKAKKSKT